MEAKEVKDVLEYLGTKGEVMVNNYAHWYIIASLAYMGFGAIIIYLAHVFSKKADNQIEQYAIFGAGLFLGLWVIFAQIPDLFAPQGIATHQLIKDLRGK